MALETSKSTHLDQYPLPDLTELPIQLSSTFWSRFKQRWSGDYHFRFGYILLGINALLLLLIGVLTSYDNGANEFKFMVVPVLSYVLTQIYGINIWRSKRHTVKLGVLYFTNLYVGCFILNFCLPVFESPTVLWAVASAATVLMVAAEPFKDLLGPKSKSAYLIMAGIGLAVLLHQSLFILFSEVSFFGAVGLLVGGFGLFAFVPAFLLIALLVHLGPTISSSPKHYLQFGISFFIPILALGIFCAAFNERTREIASIPASEYKLPQAVQILERVQGDWLSQLVFTNKRLYQQEPMQSSNWRNARARKHSPFVYWAAKISKDTWSSGRNQSRFAQFFAQTGHDLETALWSSTGITTSSIDIQHEVSPQSSSVTSTYRFAAESNLARQGEAIYTFQLPEGAVVTGSSLVVHGVEQPGRLSTKSKAKNAYERIVGRERRDPSLVEWRNGNTVSMRIFPVTSSLPRTFSIEVTAPLQKEGDRTFIAPLGIEGPPTSKAKITHRTSSDRTQEASIGFRETNAGTRGYNPKPIYLPEHEISRHTYVRDGMAYTLEPAKPNYDIRSINRIYIDLTEGWTDVEVKQVLAKAQKLTRQNLSGSSEQVKVFGYNGASVELTEGNLQDAITTAQKRKRSYFPLYAIEDLSASVLITRDQHLSFKFDAVKGSSWASKIDQWLINSRLQSSLAHFHLGDEVPTYLKTIGSSRAISSETGDFKTLLDRLEEQRFRISADGEGIVEAFDGHARITALPSQEPNSSGDPALLQLFIYRQSLLTNLMQEPDSLSQERQFSSARQANAVTPFSSLIVLENDFDYERFHIPNVIGPNREAPPKAGNPEAVAVLDGASRPARNLDFAFEQGSGSVPEPHEWALILLSLVVLGGMYIRRS